MSDTFTPDAPAGVPAEGVSSDADNTLATVATEAESTPADAADQTGADPEGSKAKGVQKRLDELTALRRQAERDRDHWRELAMRTAGQQPQAQQPQQPSAPRAADPLEAQIAAQVGPAPKPEDFPAGEFDPAYREAERIHIRKAAAIEAQAAVMRHVQAAQAAQYQQQVTAQFQQGFAKIVAEDPNAPEVVSALAGRLHIEVANMLAEADPAVAYHVATNPEAEARIRQARTPAAVAREIGRIEARLEAAPKPPPVQQTSAPPPPPRAVRGGGSASPDFDRMSADQFAALRNQQEYGKR